jgi:integrase
VPRKAVNNPRQIRSKSCGCKPCTEQYRPDAKPTRKDCTGPWQARYRDPAGNQKAKNFPISEGGKKAAEAFLDSTRTNIRGRTYLDPKRSGVTLAAWYEKWQETQHGAATTRQRDARSWKVHVAPRFGDWPLNTIEHMDVAAWVARKGVGVYAVIRAFQLLDRLMAAALIDRRIPFNPCDGVKLPSPTPKHPDDLRPPTYEQLALVRALVPAHYRPLLIVAEESGLRWGELIDLRLQNVDFKERTISVREVIVELDGGQLMRKEQPKTSAGFRTVPLTARAEAAIREQMRLRRPTETRTHPTEGMHEEELIFRGPLGGVLSRNNFRRLWIPAIKSAGIARTVRNPKTGRTEWWPHVHDIRHAWASRLKNQGVSEPTLQKLMGHERGGKVTWLYEHASEEALAEARTILDPGPHLRLVDSNTA